MKRFSVLLALMMTLSIGMIGCEKTSKEPEIINSSEAEFEQPKTDSDLAEEEMNSLIGKKMSELMSEKTWTELQPKLTEDKMHLVFVSHGCPHCQDFIRKVAEGQKIKNIVFLVPEGMPDDFVKNFPGLDRYLDQYIIPDESDQLISHIQFVPAQFTVDKDGNILESTIKKVRYDTEGTSYVFES